MDKSHETYLQYARIVSNMRRQGMFTSKALNEIAVANKMTTDEVKATLNKACDTWADHNRI